MKSFFKSLPLVLIGVIVIALMVANRQTVVLSLGPLQYEVLVPLYLVFFGGLFLGLLLGGIILLTRKLQAQVNLHRANKENIRLRGQLKSLEAEFDKKNEAHIAAQGEPEDQTSQAALTKN